MFILDRIEENYAIIEVTDENGEITVIKEDISAISPESSEGDVLVCDNGFYITDAEATKNRKRSIYERLKNLFR